MTRLNAEQWSAYWRSGAITTFQDIFPNNYDRDIGAFWNALFGRLEDGDRVVDLACGNGALALLAAAYARESGTRLLIDALDFATIEAPKDPENAALAQQISFYPHRSLERTELDSDSYHLAMSQFGAEYGDPESTLAEIDRILKPEGSTVGLICHRHDSAVIRQGRTALEQHALCAASPLPGIVRKLQTKIDQVLRAQREPAKDRACERLRERLNDATAELHDLAERQDDPSHILQFIRSYMSPFDPRPMQKLKLADRLAALDRMDADYQAFEARMRDLLSAALSEDDLALWDKTLQGFGFQQERAEPIVMEDKLFGQALVYRR